MRWRAAEPSMGSAWVFTHSSTTAGFCGWSYIITFAFMQIRYYSQASLKCLAFHKRACSNKVMDKILNSYKFMTKVQVLKALGSMLGRKWQFDAFQKTGSKVLKLVRESEILELYLFPYHSCFGLGESCPISNLDVKRIFLTPFKTDHLAPTFPLKYNINILCS